MGMFDYVVAACPACGAAIEMQSKGGDCRLHRYWIDDAPDGVQGGLAEHEYECPDCGRAWVVAVRARLVPIGMLRVREQVRAGDDEG